MHIGSIAKRTGVTPDAIRFYERNALLPRPSRTPGGFRQYAESDVDALGFIRRVQGLGFTLKEVRDIVELRRTRLQPCGPVSRRLSQKLLHVRQKLADLEKLERELGMALRACNRGLRKRGRRCPLLSQLRADKSENPK